MFVKSLEQMEDIVDSRKFLHWDGWTVVHTFPSEKARTSKHGIFRNGRWYIQKRYELTIRGWEVPSKIIPAKQAKRESK